MPQNAASRACGLPMDFRFPGWSASLHERRCLQSSAHTIASPSERDPAAWRYDDLDDLSGDEVQQGSAARHVLHPQVCCLAWQATRLLFVTGRCEGVWRQSCCRAANNRTQFT